MKQESLRWLVVSALLISACISGQQSQEHCQEQMVLMDLYRPVRSNMAESMRQVSNEVELRSLSGQAQTLAPNAIYRVRG